MSRLSVQGLTQGVTGRIEVHEGGGATITGQGGIALYRLIAIRSGFKMWRATGMQPTRGVRIKRLVQETTGLKTSKDDILLLAKLDAMIAEAEGKVLRVGPEDVAAGGVAP